MQTNTIVLHAFCCHVVAIAHCSMSFNLLVAMIDNVIIPLEVASSPAAPR